MCCLNGIAGKERKEHFCLYVTKGRDQGTGESLLD